MTTLATLLSSAQEVSKLLRANGYTPSAECLEAYTRNAQTNNQANVIALSGALIMARVTLGLTPHWRDGLKLTHKTPLTKSKATLLAFQRSA